MKKKYTTMLHCFFYVKNNNQLINNYNKYEMYDLVLWRIFETLFS
jgi:hypothetical protein